MVYSVFYVLLVQRNAFATRRGTVPTCICTLQEDKLPWE